MHHPWGIYFFPIASSLLLQFWRMLYTIDNQFMVGSDEFDKGGIF